MRKKQGSAKMFYCRGERQDTTRILWYSVGQKPTQNMKNSRICVGIAWAREPR